MRRALNRDTRTSAAVNVARLALTATRVVAAHPINAVAACAFAGQPARLPETFLQHTDVGFASVAIGAITVEEAVAAACRCVTLIAATALRRGGRARTAAVTIGRQGGNVIFAARSTTQDVGARIGAHRRMHGVAIAAALRVQR